MAQFDHELMLETERAEQNARQLEDAIRRANDELARGEGATRRFGEAAGQMGTAAGKLGGLLGRINPELEEQARLVNDVADAAEVGAAAWAKFLPMIARVGVQGPLAAAAIGGIALSVGALYGATGPARERMKKYAEVLDLAKGSSDRLAAAQNVLKLAVDGVGSFVSDLQIQTALLNGEITQGDAAAGKLGNQLADQLAPRFEELNTQLTESKQSLTEVETAMASGELRGKKLQEASDAASTLRDEVNGLTLQIGQLELEQQNASMAISDYADALDNAGSSSDDAGASITTTTEALTDQGDAAQQLIRDLEALSAAFDALPTDPIGDDFRARVGDFAPEQAPLAPDVQAGMLKAEAAVLLSRGQITQEGYNEAAGQIQAGEIAGTLDEIDNAFAELNAALAGVIAELEGYEADAAALRAQRTEGVNTAFAAMNGDVGAISTLAGGALSKVGEALGDGALGGALGSAGGILSDVAGGPVGAVIGGLTQLGAQAAGAEAQARADLASGKITQKQFDKMAEGGFADDVLKEKLEGITDAIMAAAEALPEILVNIIPAFVRGLVMDLPPALRAAFFDALQELFEKLFPRLASDGKESKAERSNNESWMLEQIERLEDELANSHGGMGSDQLAQQLDASIQAYEEMTGEDYDGDGYVAGERAQREPSQSGASQRRSGRAATTGRMARLAQTRRRLGAQTARQGQGGGQPIVVNTLSFDTDAISAFGGRFDNLTSTATGLRRTR